MALITFDDSPALKTAALFAIGILIGRFLNIDVHALIVIAVSILMFLMGCFRGGREFSGALSPIAFLLVILLGALNGVSGINTPPPAIAEGANSIVTGEILGPPAFANSRARFLLQMFSVRTDSGIVTCRSKVQVTVLWKQAGNVPPPRYGMTVALRGALSRPPGERNPGEFNQRQFFAAGGIDWVLFVRKPSDMHVMKKGGGAWIMREAVLPVRSFALSAIDSLVGGQEGEFLKGVMLGERGGMTRELRSAFTAAGVAHILAVSGSNVAVVAGFFFFAFELLRLSGRLRIIVACAGVIYYMLLVGDQPPVVRATIMALVMLGGRLVEERINPFNSLGVAGLIVLAMDARQLFDIGFQLSFVAVLSIIALYPGLNALVRRRCGTGRIAKSLLPVLQICAVSLVASIGTLPLTAAYFGQVSVIGLLANILVVPASGFSLLLGFIMIPGFLAGPVIGESYGALNRLILELTLAVTSFAGGLPFAAVDDLRFGIGETILFYLAVLLVFNAGDRAAFRLVFLFFLISLVMYVFVGALTAEPHSTGILRATFLDVGQGDAALIELPGGETILVDGGPKSPSFDSGDRIIAPFLKRKGILRIDLLVVTHPHSDHLGGVPALLEQFDVAEVLDCGQVIESSIFREYIDRVQEESCTYRSVAGGGIVDRFGGVRLYLFPSPVFPGPDNHTGQMTNLNNASVIVKIVYGTVALLLMGDAETEVEDRIAPLYRDFLASSLLKIGHHGSRTSSSQAFLEYVQPRYAIISVGQFNTFGHPSPAVLQRLRDSGIRIHRTDQTGAAVFETDGKTLREIVWRNK